MKVQYQGDQHNPHIYPEEQQNKMLVDALHSPSPRNNNQKQTSFQLTKRQLCKIMALVLCIVIVVLGLSIYTQFFRIGKQRYKGGLQKYLPIHSGEIHYSRIPWEYWEHRILMIKAMGLNSLSVYVMWNHHQTAPGNYDFSTQNKNLSLFLTLAKKHDMKVLFRPGPYVCAEWDFGGLPARFIHTYGTQVRSDNPEYQMQVFVYFKALKPVIESFLAIHGGPIIMIQLQNELGYVRNNSKHTSNLLKFWHNLGIETQFYIEDPGQLAYKNYIPGVHIGLSESKYIQRFLNIQHSGILKDTLIFGGQVYSGWFTPWGKREWSTYDAEYFNTKIRDYIFHNRSVSIYMAAGGTNFGLTGGANGLQPHEQYSPQVTSYDYDSPITEQGTTTFKYDLLRKTFQQFYGQDHKLIDIPVALKTISIKNIKMTKIANIWGNLPQATIKEGQLTYFQSNQLKMYNQGIALYETSLVNAKPYLLKIQARDYAMIFLDNKFVANTSRVNEKYYLITVMCVVAPCRLRILVEAMGHVNYGVNIGLDKKGLIHFQEIGQIQQTEYKWSIYKIQLNQYLLDWKLVDKQYDFPYIYEGKFELKQVGDTYFSMQRWGKGYVWVNGRNLGRYWSIGPQFNLFCPGVWLKVGQNNIKFLQLQNISQNLTVQLFSIQTLK